MSCGSTLFRGKLTLLVSSPRPLVGQARADCPNRGSCTSGSCSNCSFLDVTVLSYQVLGEFVAQITGTACKIMTHEKGQNSQAKAREETTVVVGEAPCGTQPCPCCCWRCGHQAYRHAREFKFKKALQGRPTPRVDFPNPDSPGHSPSMGSQY